MRKKRREERLSSEIDDWSVEKIKRVGGDAVKVLAWYRPDSGKQVQKKQKEFVARIGDACAKYDIPFVFELLVHPLAADAEQTSDYIEMRTKKPDLVLESVRAFGHSQRLTMESMFSSSRVHFLHKTFRAWVGKGLPRLNNGSTPLE